MVVGFLVLYISDTYPYMSYFLVILGFVIATIGMVILLVYAINYIARKTVGRETADKK